jgi:hypothetical protein
MPTMNLKGNIKLIDSNSKISSNMLKALTDELKTIISKKKPRIESEIKSVIRTALMKSPEIESLVSGKLKLDFGLDFNPSNELVDAIIGATYVYFRSFKLTLNGASNALSIYIQPSDFANLLNQQFGQVITEKGVSLPWLSWLLTEGDAIIITQYGVEYGPSSTSRSGGAIMKPGGVFKVDSAFSGTTDDNFITRALEGYEDKIKEIIRKNI